MSSESEYVEVSIRLDAHNLSVIDRAAELSGLTRDQMCSAVFALASMRLLPEPEPTESET